MNKKLPKMMLQGIKVVELAGLAPGPYCGKVLSDFGASVVRVDRPNTMEYNWMDAHKRSIQLDLKKPSAIKVVKNLCNSYDVLIDPYRPGVLERLGLGPSDLMKTNPKLIYARLSGFGQSGPLSSAAGHDINYVALSGILSLLGKKNDPPNPPINLLADFAGGGLLCAFGVVVALFNRTHTGLGQIVDTSMSEGAAYVGSWLYSSSNSYVWGKPRGENVLDSGAHFYNAYETKDGKYMAVGSLEPQFYKRLLQGLGLNPENVEHMDKFEKNKVIFEAKFKEKTREEWCEIFGKLDACVTPVLSMEEAPLHPHNRERKNFMKVKGHWEPAPSPRLTDVDGNMSDVLKERQRDNPHCPIPGEHSHEILQELGYSPQEIDEISKVSLRSKL